MVIDFVVFGTPRPQGSMRAFLAKGHKRPIITSDNKKLKTWRQEISATALVAMRQAGEALIGRSSRVSVRLSFFLAKPQSVKREFPTVKPDVDKLTRGCLDALTGIVFEDDAQVCAVTARKEYGLPERVEIYVAAFPPDKEDANNGKSIQGCNAFGAKDSSLHHLPS